MPKKSDLAARVEALERYQREDGERWDAIHARRQAIEGIVCMLIEAMAAPGSKRTVAKVIQGLAYMEEHSVRDNSHPSFLATVRGFLGLLEHHVADLDRRFPPKPHEGEST